MSFTLKLVILIPYKLFYDLNSRTFIYNLFDFFTGIGGSGRQSATKLAAFMSDFELFSIEITKNYNIPEWREDLRKMMRKAGDEGISMVFLFGDHQIKVI